MIFFVRLNPDFGSGALFCALTLNPNDMKINVIHSIIL